jgi:hypothetical protein
VAASEQQVGEDLVADLVAHQLRRLQLAPTLQHLADRKDRLIAQESATQVKHVQPVLLQLLVHLRVLLRQLQLPLLLVFVQNTEDLPLHDVGRVVAALLACQPDWICALTILPRVARSQGIDGSISETDSLLVVGDEELGSIELDFLDLQEELLSSFGDDVLLVAVLEGGVKGLLELGDRLDGTHRSQVLFVFVLSAVYQQVLLVPLALRWTHSFHLFICNPLLYRLFLDCLVLASQPKAVRDKVVQLAVTLALDLPDLVVHPLLESLGVAVDFCNQVLSLLVDVAAGVVLIDVVNIPVDVV